MRLEWRLIGVPDPYQRAPCRRNTFRLLRGVRGMASFPMRAESRRFRYGVVYPERIDTYELYEHVRTRADGIEDVTRWMKWDPHWHPKETAEFVASVGE